MYSLKDNQILLDRYKIIKALGTGGMGEVYEAQDLKLDRSVALKTIKSESILSDSKKLDKFKKECILTAKLEHPNIIRVYDFIEENGSYYLIMEHLKGRSLKDLINSKSLTKTEINHIYNKSYEALLHLHDRTPPIYHRDISPHNIFITDDNKVKLIDFGVSKVLDDEEEATSTHYYKMTYSCPELWENGKYAGEKYKAKHDLYSLALVKYEMLTGQKVFQELEATQGFPKSLPSSGEKSLDEFIRSGFYKQDSIAYSEQTLSTPAVKNKAAKKNYISRLIVGVLSIYTKFLKAYLFLIALFFWWAGRKIAATLREDMSTPIKLDSDGTVF